MRGRLAAITGASAGLGAAFARKLAARGFDVLLIARREDRLRALARDLSATYGVAAHACRADLTREDDLAAVETRLRESPNLALLVNNAGFGTRRYFVETDPEHQAQMARLHVVAVVRLTHAALANLAARGEAGTGVINVSSVAAFSTAPQNVMYNSTKTWMNRFTEGLAVELRALRSPVNVQALCPGFTLTEFHDVLGMERSEVPRSLWMPADFVVEESLKGFARRRTIVVPGWRYKLIVVLLRCLPDALIRWGSIHAVRRYRQRRAR
jgi:short-subunit dehydrogenase